MLKKQLSILPSFSVIMVFLLLVLVGVVLLPELNVQLNPSKSLPSVQVGFYWPDASARIVEQEVTSKLEGAFNQIKGIQEIASTSRKGGGVIDIQFDKKSSLEVVRFEMAMVIRQLYQQLPEKVSYPEISLSTQGTKNEPLLSYTVNSAAAPMYIYDYVNQNILPQLANVASVSKVEVYGSSPFVWAIELDVSKLTALGISNNEVAESINSYFKTDIIGISKSNSGKSIQVALKSFASDKVDWRRIPVAKIDRRIVLLGQIAQIKMKEQTPTAYHRINGLNTINVVVYGEKGVNSLKIAARVKDEIDKIEAHLPSGYELLLTYDETDYIEKELRKIGLRTIFSLSVLLLFVMLFSRNWRYMVLILSSLLTNLLLAIIFYYLLNIEIHIYSLAGITVSFGMIIDNSIIMIDHIRNKGNRKVFLAILAATLTTIGALSVVFLLPDDQRMNLIDFSVVVIINLAVSIVVALFFIPALYEKVPLTKKHSTWKLKRKRQVVCIGGKYHTFVLFARKWRGLFLIVALLGFGIPLHLLPDNIKSDRWIAKAYNQSIGAQWTQNQLLPVAEKVLGGSFRLFSEYVYEGNFYAEPGRTKLYVRGKMPEGCTIEQLNTVVRRMEQYIGTFGEVDLYQTTISSPQNAQITIYFNKENENSGFPYYLKELLTQKAISLGGLDWSIYGVGRGFSNALSSDYKSNQIYLTGYNYEILYHYAELLGNKLKENSRVRDLLITGSRGWSSKSLQEFFIDFDRKNMITYNLSFFELYEALQQQLVDQRLNAVFVDGKRQDVIMQTASKESFDVWHLANGPLSVNGNDVIFSGFGKIDKRATGNEIYKINQEYQLTVAFDFVGPAPLARKVIEREIDSFEPTLPIGYKVKNHDWGAWGFDDKKPVFLIVVALLIIYFICAILLESLLQPLSIILMIPISFIGVFLTFYWFDFTFDQGGFASFVLLAGIVVNAGLYIINHFNQENTGNIKTYVKSLNNKIIPILLTILSTLLGLIPFIWRGQNEAFWFSFAVGAIGGLVFSMLALFIYLPLLLKFKK